MQQCSRLTGSLHVKLRSRRRSRGAGVYRVHLHHVYSNTSISISIAHHLQIMLFISDTESNLVGVLVDVVVAVGSLFSHHGNCITLQARQTTHADMQKSQDTSTTR